MRSTTLDVQVWEDSILAMFEALGNNAVNAVLEHSLHLMHTRSIAARNDVFYELDNHNFDTDLTPEQMLAMASHNSTPQSASTPTNVFECAATTPVHK